MPVLELDAVFGRHVPPHGDGGLPQQRHESSLSADACALATSDATM
jgi:hypothetical protein